MAERRKESSYRKEDKFTSKPEDFVVVSAPPKARKMLEQLKKKGASSEAEKQKKR